MTGTPEDSTESGFIEKQGIEAATPGLQDTGLSPTPRRLHLEGTKKTFCGFSMGRNQYWAGRVYDLCVHYMTGTSKAQPKVVLWRSQESNLRPLVYKA